MHYIIRIYVLKEIVLGELNKLLETIKENEEKFINSAMDHSIQKKSSELAKAIELSTIIANAEKRASNVTAFLKAVHKYEHIIKLTPEIMHELIEKIVVHEADKSSRKRDPQIPHCPYYPH